MRKILLDAQQQVKEVNQERGQYRVQEMVPDREKQRKTLAEPGAATTSQPQQDWRERKAPKETEQQSSGAVCSQLT